jgi:hypothetical protein
MEQKRCTKCGETKPLSEFYRNKRKPDGRHSWCKACMREYQAKYNQTAKGRESQRGRSLRYRQTAKGREAQRRHSQSEKARETKRRYQRSEKWRDYQRRWRTSEEGCEYHRKYLRAYRQSDHGREIYRKANARQHAKYPKRRRARSAVANAIQASKIPPACMLTCADCGRPAQHYHHESYDREHWLDVIPLCRKCHTARHNGSGYRSGPEKTSLAWILL